ncbi:hypothetical protein Ancab_038912 [Ancistrocladus abbreviatus]
MNLKWQASSGRKKVVMARNTRKYASETVISNAVHNYIPALGLWEVHDYLKTVCPDLHITKEEYDEESHYPETKTLTIGQFKLGLSHGHQV